MCYRTGFSVDFMCNALFWMLLTVPYWAGELLFFFPCKEYLNLWDVHFIIPPMVTFFSSAYVLKADRVRGRSGRIKDWFTLVAMFEVCFFNQRPSI